MSDDEDEKTPPRQPTPRPYRMTDSERDAARHRRTFVRGVPVVRPDPADEITEPIAMLLNGQITADDYAQVEALRRSSDDVYVLLMNLAKAMNRHRDKERSGSAELERQVVKAIGDSERKLADALERLAGLERRVIPVEDTIKSVKGHGWKVALTIATTIAGSAVAVIATLNARAEKEGAMAERVLTMQRDIVELKSWRYTHSDDRPARPQRRDYDYDITPRPFVAPAPKKDPEP